MRRILYIDYIQQKGHVNFHRIHIDALKREGYNVKLVLHRDIAQQLPYPKKDYILVLPSFLDQHARSPLLNRVIFLLTLIYIKICVRLKRDDKVIIACLDEITLGLLPLKKHMNIICHGNANGFSNPIKHFFLKKLARNNSFIVFNEYMARPFKENSVNDVHIISHGCPPAFIFEDVLLPIELHKFNKVIFHPSSKANAKFVCQLISHPVLSDILKENKVLLLLRNKPMGLENTENIRFLNHYLTQQQYRQLFLRADIILLAYPDSFKYQVSGVSFECIANQKKILISNHPSLQYCCQYYNYDPTFTDINDFCNKIQKLINNKEMRCTVSPSLLVPDYTSIFKLLRPCKYQ